MAAPPKPLHELLRDAARVLVKAHAAAAREFGVQPNIDIDMFNIAARPAPAAPAASIGIFRRAGGLSLLDAVRAGGLVGAAGGGTGASPLAAPRAGAAGGGTGASPLAAPRAGAAGGGTGASPLAAPRAGAAGGGTAVTPSVEERLADLGRVGALGAPSSSMFDPLMNARRAAMVIHPRNGGKQPAGRGAVTPSVPGGSPMSSQVIHSRPTVKNVTAQSNPSLLSSAFDFLHGPRPPAAASTVDGGEGLSTILKKPVTNKMIEKLNQTHPRDIGSSRLGGGARRTAHRSRLLHTSRRLATRASTSTRRRSRGLRASL
jgi:hypothetical protein